MKPALILDTHVWLWWLLGQPQLSAIERDTLESVVFHPGCKLGCPAKMGAWLLLFHP